MITAVKRAALAFFLALLLSGPALAGIWTRIETERVVVHGEASEREVREYATKLVNFDAVLRLLNPQTRGAPVRDKLHVYLLRDVSELSRIVPGMGDGVGGFYRATPSEVFVVVRTDNPDFAQHILFHEYAHHFMFENFPGSYPAWFVEGWAEYYSTTKITPEKVVVGGYEPGRAENLAMRVRWVRMEDLLSKPTSSLSGEEMAMFYAQSWLLMHYMRSTDALAASLNQAMDRIANGEAPLAAFEGATGVSAKTLERQLRAYRRLTLKAFKLPQTAPPTMTATRLPDSADRFLFDRLRLTNADLENKDTRFIASVRAKARAYPDDRYAQLTLAAAEFGRGDVQAGEAIIKRWTTADASDLEALRTGTIGYRTAADRFEDRRPEYFRAARAMATRAYKIDKDDPAVLNVFAYARSLEKSYPSANDLNVLLSAYALAPAVDETTFLLGDALIRHDRQPEGLRLLQRVANNPHGGPLATAAKAIIEGKAVDAVKIVAEADTGGS